VVDESEFSASVDDIDRAPLVPTTQPREVSWREYEALFDKHFQTSQYNFELLEENARLKREKATSDTLNEIAKPMASKTFWFMCVYSAVVGIILLLDGFSIKNFNLEPEILNFLVGSTAATVNGLVATILTGVFISRPK